MNVIYNFDISKSYIYVGNFDGFYKNVAFLYLWT